MVGAKKMRNKWFVAYKKRQSDIFNTDNFTVIEPPDGTYQADPFPFIKDGKRYLFIEDYDYKLGKLSVCNVNSDGTVTPFRTAIQNNYHFSYPHIFNYKDDIYIVPETSRHGVVELYKCSEFPDKWIKIKTLLNIPGNDSTIFERDGILWMFTNIGNDNNITIFYTDNLLSEWKFHSSHTYSHSRPAGQVFYYKDKLIRPTQDCSKCYGHAIVFKEIELDKKIYKEKVFKRIEPTWSPN